VSSIAKYNKYKPVIYNGPRVIRRFFFHLRQEQVLINRILSKNKRMNSISEQQLKDCKETTKCPECDVEMTKKNKFRHHCHITRNVTSAVCYKCNPLLRYRKRTKGKHVTSNYLIPVVFHNLRGYIAHLIIKHLSRFEAPKDVRVMANNMEKYISFEIDDLRFVDFLQFLSCSLGGLVKNLEKSLDKDKKDTRLCPRFCASPQRR